MIGKVVDKRIAALRRFAVSITVFTVAGAFFLSFEDSWAQPVVALVTCYVLELALETLDARCTGRPVRYAGGPKAFVDYLLPAHITGLSIALLLYPNARLMPIVFACAVAVGSKFVFQAPVGEGRRRHFLNPSNFGIAVTLLAFPWVGISPPYQFTEGVSGIWGSGTFGWLVPAAVLISGTALNAKLTGKWPLMLGWLGAFVLQALVRAAVFGTPVVAPLLPLTGLVFVLYTNYMITDPGTTPVVRRNQVAFGAATALVYGVLVSLHVVFGLFFALALVSAARGLGLYGLAAWAARARRAREAAPADLGVARL
jgi:Na+-translocating ferredoxin:NAD+ oxidoreductase RnfD subunit